MLNRMVLIFIGGLMVFCLAPFAGEDSAGLGPVSVSWAAPNCDSDNDNFESDKGKWCNGEPADPDDSDPCIVPEGFTPDPDLCGDGGSDGGGDAPDPYNLARASFATRAELGNPIGGVFADQKPECEGYNYWDWQEELLPAGVGLPCPFYANSSNVSGGGRWFLISSPAGSNEVVNEVERWLTIDFTHYSTVLGEDSPCYNLDFRRPEDPDYSSLDIPLYLTDQIAENTDPCIDNVSVRLAADRILKAKANQQQLEFSIRHRPDPDASIYWAPWGYVSYIQPLYLRDPMPGDPNDWVRCRVMSTRPAPDQPHDRDEAELQRQLGPGTTEVIGTYYLPLEVCVSRASD